MPRVIVEAVGNPVNAAGSKNTNIKIVASVSEADSGVPVNNLNKANFRITNLYGNQSTTDTFLSVSERTWDPDDTALSGVYDITIQVTSNTFQSFMPDKQYVFGLQVFSLSGFSNPDKMLFGQTIVSVSLLTM